MGLADKRSDSYGNFPVKRVYLIDMLCLVVSFFAAIIIRYREQAYEWAGYYDGLYVSLLIVLVLIRTIVFLLYDARRRSIYEQDPIENLASVFKSITIVMVLVIFYLYATQRGELSSRFIIAAIYLFGMVSDYVCRMINRSRYLKRDKVIEDDKVLELCFPYPEAGDIKRLVSEGGYREVLIIPGDEDAGPTVELCESMGLRTYVGLQSLNMRVSSGLTYDVNGYAAVPASIRSDRYDVFGVKYAISTLDEAVFHVIRHLGELSGRYICFSNVHTLVMAREDKDYKDALNGSAITFADGNPIAQMQQRSGLERAERVAGPDFMDRMFAATADGSVSHYFYGSSQKTLDALKERLTEKYPDMNIAGMYSPPYRELTPGEDSEDVKRINEAGADLVWIGLGAPKQERWMAAHKDKINGVMLGVGAGFDFHAGTTDRAPVWLQKVGLEWFYRLIRDPKRLIKRYFVSNTKFYLYRMLRKLKHE